MQQKSFAAFLAVVTVVITGGLWQDCQNQTPADEIIPLSKSWESPIPHHDIPDGLTSLSAEACGVCHPKHYTEWKQSTHAVAWQDPQFQAELKKENIVFCLNCHTPLQNQQEFEVKGKVNGDYSSPVLERNPHFDRSLQLESITCATCHVRDGKVIGTQGITTSAHTTIRDVEFLSETICLSCHNVVDVLNPTLVCTFETGEEWKNNWAKPAGKNCISCHMPSVERSIYPGMAKRPAHEHHFPASGIPKFYGLLPAKLTSLEIQESHLDTLIPLGDSLHYSLTLKNSFAGHAVPTGDPERYIIILLTLRDSLGRTVNTRQFRIGEEWQWYPLAKKVHDNNLQPLEKRDYRLTEAMLAPGRYRLQVEITKHRMNEENARHHELLEHYPLFIHIFNREHHLTVK